MNTSAQVMTLYLDEVGSYPRLSPQQEKELATRVARGRLAQRKLSQSPPPDTRRRQALQDEVARGKAAQRRLIECNLRLVVFWARRTNMCGLPLEDLIQEGNIGLMKAIERYDPRQGVRLSTYAQWWIKKALYKAAADIDAPIRLPERANQERLRLRRVAARLELSLARAPTQAELAAESGLSPARVASVQRWDREYQSLDAPLGPSVEQSLTDVLADQERGTLHETYSGCELRVHLRRVLDAHLTPDERAYLRVRFGLDGAPPRTQRQAARDLGLSPQHAIKIEKRALRQLRRDRTLHEWRA